MKLRRIFLASMAAFMFTPLHAQQQPWKIGALYPLTGSLALLGTENLNGAKIAVDMINEQGGIAGQRQVDHCVRPDAIRAADFLRQPHARRGLRLRGLRRHDWRRLRPKHRRRWLRRRE